MFEDITYEIILQRMLDRVPNNMDKREGSIIWNALAPAAIELQEMYISLDSSLNETFAGTATREYLIKHCADDGIVPHTATSAILKAEFDIDVPIGSRFSLDNLNYEAVEKIENGIFKMKCESVGVIGNSQLGSLIPIDYIEGLTSAELTELLIPGEDEESTEDLRERYFEDKNSQAMDGNIAQYKKWANEFKGIGRSKVFPLWNGPNTVKVSVLNSDQGVASSTLIKEFQDHLDPNSKGLGNGVAPIGSIVTVSTASSITVNVSGDLELSNGYLEAEGVDAAISEYLKSISYEKTTVSYMGLGAVLLGLPSVDAIRNLKINDGVGDVTLVAEQIPIYGTGTFTVVTK